MQVGGGVGRWLGVHHALNLASALLLSKSLGISLLGFHLCQPCCVFFRLSFILCHPEYCQAQVATISSPEYGIAECGMHRT